MQNGDKARVQLAPVLRGALAVKEPEAPDGIRRAVLQFEANAGKATGGLQLPAYESGNESAFLQSCREAIVAAEAPACLQVAGLGTFSVAPLGEQSAKPLAGQVALITGAASGIGAATAALFAEEGAQLVLLDMNEDGLKQLAAEAERKGGGAVTVQCDVTKPEQVVAAVERAVLRFGGLDIIVSNAGRIWQGKMAEVSMEDLRASFELNFFAHQMLAAEAVKVMLRQGTGGQLLFNASKSAFNPGPAMGPYTLPKAAVIALMKQYAVEYGDAGIRSNAINADRVPTNIFGAGVLEQRASARDLSIEEYLSGNLLKRVVYPQDVARAFLLLAYSEKTTGATLPVDGGNIAAAPR